MTTLDEFREAIGSVLFGKQPKDVKSENRMPTKDELNQRWRLVRRPKSNGANTKAKTEG